MRIPFFATLLLLAAPCVTPHAAHAAESYDNCSGFIDSLPAVVDKQGVYCLRKDLSTAQTSGAAINITTNNVTIDCNDFKIGGLAGGAGSTAFGINADNRQNATIRHCNLRGFFRGINLEGGAGHLIEDNRLDNNLKDGIYATGVHSLIRRNRVYDTGGATGAVYASGIVAIADITDNIVDGVFASEQAFGITAKGEGAVVSGNRVGGLLATNSDVFGMIAENYGQRFADNHVVGAASGDARSGYGIYASSNTVCSGNSVIGFSTNTYAC